MLDDINGTPAAHTIPFSLDGVTYDIDLSEGNAAALRDELARFISAGRRIGGRKVRVATGQPATTTAPTANAISRSGSGPTPTAARFPNEDVSPPS